MSEDEAENSEEIEVPVPGEGSNDLEKNFTLYRMLLNYPDREKVPAKEIADQLKVPYQKLGGLLSQAANNPKIYHQLVEAGYKESQIPGWIARETTAKPGVVEREQKPLDTTPRAASFPGKARPIGIPAPMGRETPPDSGELTPTQIKSPEVLGTGLEVPRNLAQLYGQGDEVRRNLEKANVVQTSDGRWARARVARLVESDDDEGAILDE